MAGRVDGVPQIDPSPNSLLRAMIDAKRAEIRERALDYDHAIRYMPQGGSNEF